MLNVIFGIITIIGTCVTIWQAYLAKRESKLAKILAEESKKSLDEIKLIQRAIDLTSIKNEVDKLYKKIGGLTFSQRGVNEQTIKSEIIEVISVITSNLSNHYSSIHSEVEGLKNIIFEYSSDSMSLFDQIGNNETGIKKMYNQIFIVLKLIKDEIENI